MAGHLPPIGRELTKKGDRLIVRNAQGRPSSTIKLTERELEYLRWLEDKHR
jgi:hypothetical protein